MIQENYMTISQINNYLKLMFDENPYLKKIYLKGEISNFKHHTSGHLYLTLKDDDSRINAIMFKSAAQSLNFKPEDGMNVLVTGRISVYPSGGSYQIYIDKMETDGLGSLYIEFEKLKKSSNKKDCLIQDLNRVFLNILVKSELLLLLQALLLKIY